MSSKQEKNCEYHGKRSAVAKCKVCGRDVCRYCAQTDEKGKPICRPCCVARGVRQKRSRGVTVLAILAIIFGGLGVTCIPLLSLIPPSFSHGHNPEWAIPGYKAWQTADTVLSLCSSGAGLISGIGLMRLRDWARKMTIVLQVCLLGSFAVNTVLLVAWLIPARSGAGHPGSALSMVIFSVIYVGSCVLYIVFFTRRMVKVQFGQPPEESAETSQ